MSAKSKVLMAISIMVLLIIILITAILVLNKKEINNTNNEASNHISNQDETSDLVENNNIINNSISYNFIETNKIIEEDIFNKVKYVSNKKEYFTIKNIVNNYIELTGDNNREKLINLISPSYLQEFNVSLDTLIYSVPVKENYTQTYYIDINNMFETKVSDKTKLYFVEGNVSIKYTQQKYPLNIMIEVDRVNLLYNIYPSEYLAKYKLNNLKVGNTIEFKENEVTNRNNINKYSYINTITDRDIANNLFDDFIYKLKMDKISAYEKLNSKYSQNRFNNFETFNQYLNEMNELIKINQYTVYSTDNYTDYICTDQYNNYYIFRQQDGIMRYSVFLDSYTLELGAFKTAYEEGDYSSKISTQIDKIRQMLNMKDYNAIYYKLNTVFRYNNFKNVSDLKEYLKNNIYDINYIEVNEYYENEDYYVCECTLQNQKNTNESKSMNIIIKLIDYNNFEISFSFE